MSAISPSPPCVSISSSISLFLCFCPLLSRFSLVRVLFSWPRLTKKKKKRKNGHVHSDRFTFAK